MRSDEFIEESGYPAEVFDNALETASLNEASGRLDVRNHAYEVASDPTDENIAKLHASIHHLWRHQQIIESEGVCEKTAQGFTSCILPAYHAGQCKGPLPF